MDLVIDEVFQFYFLVTSSGILLIFGLIFNILVIIIFSSKRFRRHSMSRYLIALAISDLIELISSIMLNFNGMHEVNTPYCKAIGAIVLQFFQLCSNIITLEHIDRTLTILYGRTLAIKDTAVFQTGCLIACVVLSIPTGVVFAYKYEVVSYTNGTFVCDVPDLYFQFIAQIVVGITVTIIPSCIMLICTGIIIKRLVDSNRRFSMRKTFGRREMYLFKTMIATYLFFLFCNMPVFIYLVMSNYNPSLYSFFIFNVMNAIAVVHNAFSFIVYFASNSKFRRQFISLFKKKKEITKITTTQQTND